MKSKRKILSLTLSGIILILNLILLFNLGIGLDEGVSLDEFMNGSSFILFIWSTLGLSILLMLSILVLPKEK